MCNYFEGKSFSYPAPPDLPEVRVHSKHAFNAVGLDYAGPIRVKNIFGEDDDLYKCWIALVTCASTRAIYLDIAVNCSAQECIEVLKRLTARHGAPETIISDNGKAFVSEEVQDFAASKNIQWKFNFETAPWQGGFFERMVGSTKRCLKKLLFRSTVTFNELLTLLHQIEAVIDNRPLTYVYSELTDVPLTPNHLIYGRTLESVVARREQPEELTQANADRHSKYVRDLLKHFF